MKRFTYCWSVYGSTTIEAEDREEADKEFDELDMREYEDDWELTLVQEEDENGKIINHVM